MKKSKIIIMILLHALFMVYSMTGIVSKLAAANDFLSIRWCLLYGSEIVILGIYALGWQQIIKRLPLTAAYANKAVTIIWGLVWGMIFFDEKVSALRVVGAVMVIAGVVLFSIADGNGNADIDADADTVVMANGDATGESEVSDEH